MNRYYTIMRGEILMWGPGKPVAMWSGPQRLMSSDLQFAFSQPAPMVFVPPEIVRMLTGSAASPIMEPGAAGPLFER